MTEEGVQYETAPQSLALMPAMTIGQAVERYRAMAQFVAELLVEDVDFGVIPGTNKPTLLKPGAEKLTTFFGLSPAFFLENQVEDWTGEKHGGEPFFYFRYACELHIAGRPMPVGAGVGSCNSWEKKYRYRTAQRTCPGCKQPAIIKGKEEYGGGWICWKPKGGCGHKYLDGDATIEGQELGQILNENPADLVNTIDKMAQKRALVAATLITVNASEFFTQDLDDMVVKREAKPEAETGKPEAEPEKPPQKPKRKPRQKPKAERKSTAQPKANNELDAMEWGDFYAMVADRWNIDPKAIRGELDKALGRTDWGTDTTKAELLAILEKNRHQEEDAGE